MNNLFRNSLCILLLLWYGAAHAFTGDSGHISGTLLLDDSWERKIYVSYIPSFEKEYAVSNDLIVTSAVIDEQGHFELTLADMPTSWSLLRIHVVKKGITSNSLVIGSIDENFMFLIARRSSVIQLYNSEHLPLFKDARVEGADHMQIFHYVKMLSEYPSTIDYDSSVIEREFIEAAVFEKLKRVADTCVHPLVALYALSKTDFKTDYLEDQQFYKHYLSKWANEESPYFQAFRLNFLPKEEVPIRPNTRDTSSSSYLFLLPIIAVLAALGIYFFRKRRSLTISVLSVKEREIFDLLRKGMTNKEISSECNIELTTVKSHVSSIYSKLKIKSRKEAMDLKLK